MSASSFLVSAYLIWILGSKLILSNNQSSATLCVLDTCLIVGLLPLVIILITASVSSKMYNWDSPWEEWLAMRRICVCGDVVHTCDKWSTSWCPSGLGLGVFCKQLPVLVIWFCLLIGILQSPHPIILTAGKPSIRSPASNEMISDSVELWDTDVCFLHIQLMETSVRLLKIHKTPPEVDFESSRSPAKSVNPIDNADPSYPHDNAVWWMYEINLSKRLSQACVHLAPDPVSLFTDHGMSSLPIRAKYKHFKTNCEQYFWFLSNWSKFLLLELMIIQAWAWNFVQLLSLPVFQVAVSLNAFWSMSFHVVGPRNGLCVRFYPSW